jgi:hypothetical protein
MLDDNLFRLGRDVSGRRLPPRHPVAGDRPDDRPVLQRGGLRLSPRSRTPAGVVGRQQRHPARRPQGAGGTAIAGSTCHLVVDHGPVSAITLPCSKRSRSGDHHPAQRVSIDARPLSPRGAVHDGRSGRDPGPRLAPALSRQPYGH